MSKLGLKMILKGARSIAASFALAGVLQIVPGSAAPAAAEESIESRPNVEAQNCEVAATSSDSETVLSLGAMRPSPALLDLAKQSNELRRWVLEAVLESEISVTTTQREDLIRRLVGTGDAIAVLPAENQSARVLTHVSTSLDRLAPDYSKLVNGKPLARTMAGWLNQAIAAALQFEDRKRAARARLLLADLYEDAGQWEDALQIDRRALLDASHANDLRSLYQAQWRIGRIRREMNEPIEALDAYRAAVDVLERMRSQLVSESREREYAFRQEVAPVYLGLVDQLLRTPVADPGDRVAAHLRQAALAEARDTIERFKIAELREYFRDECLDAHSTVVPEAVPGTAVIYPILLPDRVELIVGVNGRLSSHVAAIDGPSFEREIKAFRNNLEDRVTRRYRRQSERFYDLLIRPIESRLSEDIETLVFVPSGGLLSIPLAALRDRETKRYLIERFAIAITPGLRLTDPRRLDRKVSKLLVGALTEAVQGYAALPGVAEEIAIISETFSTRLLIDKQFRTENFVDVFEAAPFDIVHIASHGVFSPQASESFVLTYDGRLSLDRLSRMIQQTRFREDHPLEMLILSACETAAGDDRSALGLAGMAVQSGARSVLASLWSVNDDATALLIADFYRNLGKGEMSRAGALQQAQIKLLRERGTAHPALWAPFVFIGNWQ